MPFCTSCGNNLTSDPFCTRCGAPAAAAAPPADADATTVHRPDPDLTTLQPAQTDQETFLRPQVVEPETHHRVDVPQQQPAYFPPPGGYEQPAYAVPQTRERREGGWTPLKGLAAFGYLLGVGAIGFLLTYFLNPLEKDDNTIPPPLPQLASSSSDSFTEAPTGDGEADAFTQLRRIAAQDRAALQSTQQWRAQLESSPASESAAQFLARYRETMRVQPNSLLAWSGDWPQSYGTTSRSSWVILSSRTWAAPEPVNSWCAEQNRTCWAKRLSEFGTPDENTLHDAANEGN